MVRRHGKLFEKIVSTDNLTMAFYKAARHKHWQRKVQAVESHLDESIERLHDALLTGTYKTSSYTTKTIYEPKQRLIYILPFYPDRIVHHAIMNILAPIMESMFIDNSYACRLGKGQHAGSRRVMEYVRKYRYVLQCDISKFYPSINHEVLKKLLERKFKDKRLLNLLSEIIDSVPGETNVPIGNYLSQWFGNYYLSELDKFAYEKLHCKAYMRYCDDFCLFCNDKKKLGEWANAIESFLAARLKLKLSKRKIYPVAQGIDILGYRHFPKYILVRKRTAKRQRKNLKRVMYLLRHKQITKDRALAKIESTAGWLKHAQCHHLKLAMKIDELRKEVENFDG